MLTFGLDQPGTAPPSRAPVWAGTATFTRPGAAPSLLTHHLLALAAAGDGAAEVDFRTGPFGPGTLLWIRPGQALRFVGRQGEAAIITFRRDLFAADQLPGIAVDDPGGPGRWHLSGAVRDAVAGVFGQLAADCERFGVAAAGDSRGAVAALLRHQVAALLLRVAVGFPRGGSGPGALDGGSGALDGGSGALGGAETRTFARFRRALEEGHPHSRRVEDYAARLGCSVRTLTRASLAITGRTAKQVVDDRVALEARRLLACTSLSVAEVGRRLGFGEPTNFGRFFHREVGLSPGAFRAATGGHAQEDASGSESGSTGAGGGVDGGGVDGGGGTGGLGPTVAWPPVTERPGDDGGAGKGVTEAPPVPRIPSPRSPAD